MPLYEFNCQSCNQDFEKLVPSSNWRGTAACPHCGSKKLMKKLSTFASAVATGSTGLPATDTTVYPREQTLYTSGKQWGAPSTWNPLDPNMAMGVLGLQYETLFLYDPIADKFTPWLAESGTWTDPTTYTIKTRSGVKWSDGTPFTAQDVAFTIGLAKIKAVGSNIWTYDRRDSHR